MSTKSQRPSSRYLAKFLRRNQLLSRMERRISCFLVPHYNVIWRDLTAVPSELMSLSFEMTPFSESLSSGISARAILATLAQLGLPRIGFRFRPRLRNFDKISDVDRNGRRIYVKRRSRFSFRSPFFSSFFDIFMSAARSDAIVSEQI